MGVPRCHEQKFFGSVVTVRGEKNRKMSDPFCCCVGSRTLERLVSNVSVKVSVDSPCGYSKVEVFEKRKGSSSACY